MLIDPTLYSWKPHAPESFVTETAGSISFGTEGRRVYVVEVSGMVSGTFNIYADTEKTELIGSVTYPDTLIEPTAPVCVDSLVTDGDGLAEGVSIMIYSEVGYLKSGYEEYINTTEGMTCIRNTPNDDGTDTIKGLDGFMFNGVEAENLYISGNHWIGFGANTEQLQVCRRDGKVYYIYRQEGTLADGTQFVKIRWEGYTQYNSTSETVRLIFELFLFSNNDMFLNVVQTPTNSSYFGSSNLVCNGHTTALQICDGSGGGQKVCFRAQDNQGKTWEISYGDYSPMNEYSSKYLIRSGGHYYTVEEGELEQVEMSTPTAACFYRYGVDTVPDGSLLVPLINPDVLFWTNDPDESLQMRAELVAYPFPQTLTGYADMSSETILGITMLSAEYSGEIDIRLSYDEGATYGATMSMAEFLQMDVDTLWQNCQAHKSLYIQFTLHNDARLTRFKISYKN